jgi:hypothetical protein
MLLARSLFAKHYAKKINGGSTYDELGKGHRTTG